MNQTFQKRHWIGIKKGHFSGSSKIATFGDPKWELFFFPLWSRNLCWNHDSNAPKMLKIGSQFMYVCGPPLPLYWFSFWSNGTTSTTFPCRRCWGRCRTKTRGGPHTYINCDPILSFLGACESWFQQRFLVHKGEKNSCHFGSEKVAILDDPERWSFLIAIQCLFWNVWFAETAGVSAMRRDGK